MSRPKGGITVYISCLSVVILAAIQFSLLAGITKKKEGVSPNDAPVILKANENAKPTAPFSFSACLILKDDNIILPEWLAYHYTVLPLDRLIVGVDSLSHTDPSPILDAYQKLGMNITTWKNDSFWKNGREPWAKKKFTITNTTSYDDLRRRKRHRQNVFYEACLQKLHDENRTWTMMIDADEYLAFNYYDDSEQKSTENNTRSQLLDQSSPVTMADVVSQWDIDPKLPCVTFARYLFVSTDTQDDDGKDLPQQLLGHPDFNAALFHTLRYRQRNPLKSPQAGKSILDASRYDRSPIDNPHRVKRLCTGYNVFPDNKIMPFRVHHYVGSWEAFRSPGFDPRGRSYFDKRNNVGDTVRDNTMSAWLDKFTTLVGGAEKVIEMTQKFRLHAELEMERKILEQQQQQRYDWEKLNMKTAYWA
uniref:Glycosyltransferase family 92 protein n=1 Tax=Skeletonema marinoi TaxID=267567 RepID=A0A7S2PI85_9STRA|mmetsp:Transcript_23121/g.39518  ORF Transcript_23121/g.39518 Transcript_23121/m.39518 type:complete len:419 (+) Transcript_23121:134-1390(+)